MISLGLAITATLIAAAVSILGAEDTIKIQNQEKTILKGYGFSTSLLELSPAERSQKLDEMKAAGATWVRYDLSWDSVQHGSAARYDWSAYDVPTKDAVAHGFNVLMIIDFTPPWARPANCQSSQLCGPASAEAYAKFAAAATEHFQPLGVRHWEIWNEPNISYRYRPAPNVGTYVAMLKASYTAIKQADASATVIAGVVAPSGTEKGNFTPSEFVSQLYAHGAAGSFDAISSHPYTYPNMPSKSNPYDAWGQLQAIHDMMVNHGDSQKKVWITEYSAPTNGPDKPGEKVTEAEQAKMATEAIQLFRKHDWSGPFLWYEFQDSSDDTSSSENFYGLIRADGSHKPAYDAFVTAATTR